MARRMVSRDVGRRALRKLELEGCCVVVVVVDETEIDVLGGPPLRRVGTDGAMWSHESMECCKAIAVSNGRLNHQV